MQQKARVLFFGEILWDIVQNQELLGGAPLNASVHMARLGCSVALISRVGKDRLGRCALEKLMDRGVETRFVQEDAIQPTGVAQVKLDNRGIPSYQFPKAAFDFIEWDSVKWHLQDGNFDLLYFGTLLQRNDITWQTLNKILSNYYFKEIFANLNIRFHYYSQKVLEGSVKAATILKMNSTVRYQNLFPYY